MLKKPKQARHSLFFENFERAGKGKELTQTILYLNVNFNRILTKCLHQEIRRQFCIQFIRPRKLLLTRFALHWFEFSLLTNNFDWLTTTTHMYVFRTLVHICIFMFSTDWNRRSWISIKIVVPFILFCLLIYTINLHNQQFEYAIIFVFACPKPKKTEWIICAASFCTSIRLFTCSACAVYRL